MGAWGGLLKALRGYRCLVFLLVMKGENGEGIELRGCSGNGSVRSIVNDE
ncbi:MULTISPECIES: hypothetical protein [Bartonella]|nr:hypothetical protein [Bartonella grahamii]